MPTDGTWSPEELAAMREAVAERKTARRKPADPAAAEAEVRARIEAMAPPDRALALRIHELVRAAAPGLVPRLWYGMPAYARDGRVICFFQEAGKFKTRYGTLGFQHDAALDEGSFWPVAFALTALTPEVEARIVELVRRAAG